MPLVQAWSAPAVRSASACAGSTQWRKAFAGDRDGHESRKGARRLVYHRLSEEERQRILLTSKQPQYASLPPGQIVLALADQVLYIGVDRPNAVWSWDITYLTTTVRGS